MGKKSPNWVVVVSAIVFSFYLVSGLFSEYWLGIVTHHPIGADFRIYYAAYMKANAGSDPYLPYDIGSSFVYHPFALTFVSFFAWHKDYFVASLVWIATSAAAWALSVFLALRLTESKYLTRSSLFSNPKSATRLIALVFLGFAPFWEALHIGQVNAFVVVFLCLSLYFAENDKSIASGFSLALATLLKTSPLVFIFYFLVLSRFRIVVSTLISLVVLSVVAAIQFSPQVLTDFLGILPQLGSEIHPSAYNQSILSISFRALRHLGWSNLDKALILGHKVLSCAIASVLLGSGLLIPPNLKPLRLWLFVSLLTVIVFFSPLVWYHHSTFLILPLTALILYHSRIHFAIGTSLILLIQLERLFEHIFGRVALPALLAQIILMGIVISIFFKDWWAALYSNGSITSVPRSLTQTARALLSRIGRHA